ncbi:hypothetical protein [Vibrio sp. B181a]|uniref:hypothetical protein n=1 Tax=Vibrio sp. B181a TaxID=2835906 RepID=UPI002553820B|nr:hypothetical protein [Vibrio sp. B181a]MDK9773875.1 hypothetical protein [Vibrio sp. B181a]
MTQTFEDWLNNRFSSPLDILRDDIVALSHVAADCNALVNDEVLMGLKDFHLSGNGRKFYLPNLRKLNDSKQYGVIRFGTTGNNVTIPIVIFRSYRTSFDSQAVYSPAKFLWSEYRRSKKDGVTTAPTSKAYEESMQEFMAKQEQLAKEEQKVKESALNAALQASQRLFAKSHPVTNLTTILQNKGISQFSSDETRICHSTVSSNVYFSTKDEWKDTVLAYPRDILIPIYDKTFTEVVNVQVISATNPSRKRFIPGGPTQNLAFSLGKTNKTVPSIPLIRVILEGYRTTKAAEFLHNNSNLGIPVEFIVAFSAPNIPLVHKNLQSINDDTLDIAAFDLDAVESNYAEQTKKQGALILVPPNHKHNADWADAVSDLPLNEAIQLWEHNFIEAVALKEHKQK